MANSTELAGNSVSEANADDLAIRLRRHHDAIASFAAHVRTLSDVETQTPRAPGKWTPAQETLHLTLSCRAFVCALDTGQQIALCVSAERSRELYQAIVPRVLAGGWFPRGGTSPDVAMPEDAIPSTPLAVDELEAASGEFDRAVTSAFARDPSVLTTHPYFGPMLLPELVSFLTAHVEHHRSFLPVRGVVGN